MIFFYINHFSFIIFYHLVWLGFELFESLSSSALSLGAVLRSRTKYKTITIVIINPQTGNEAVVWMT